jgi:hypothetical protein
LREPPQAKEFEQRTYLQHSALPQRQVLFEGLEPREAKQLEQLVHPREPPRVTKEFEQRAYLQHSALPQRQVLLERPEPRESKQLE